MKLKITLLLAVLFIFSGCVSEKKIKEMLMKDPTILTDAIKANPGQFIDALNEAVKKAQKGQASRREVTEKKKFEDSFNKPLVPVIRKDELIRGNKNGPITVVEYSDFECPFCSRAFGTVRQLLDTYKGKVRFVYKHLPLSFHPNAEPASQYYEAIRLQSEDKAMKFHDEIYDNQRKLQNGEKFLKKMAKKVGADMSRLAKDFKSDAVQKRIDEDKAEAAKYGFQGTPGFIVNGIPVKGAYPFSHFEKIIKELQKRGKLTL
jgi:protein-disulfide isomerase